MKVKTTAKLLGTRGQGIFQTDTEVRDFDHALAILSRNIRIAKAAETKRTKPPQPRPRTLKQEIAAAAVVTRNKIKGPPRPKQEKLPHPLKDLAPDVKRIRVRAAYHHGRGYWGWGDCAARRLAVAYGETPEQITRWIEEGR